MFRCESWTIKKAEHHRTDAFELWFREDSWDHLDCKGIKPVNPNGTQSWIFIGRTCWSWSSDTLATWWEELTLEKTLMLGKTEGKRRSGRQRMTWLDNITDSIDKNLSKLGEIVEDRGAWRAAVFEVAKTLTWLRGWTMRESHLVAWWYHNCLIYMEN